MRKKVKLSVTLLMTLIFAGGTALVPAASTTGTIAGHVYAFTCNIFSGGGSAITTLQGANGYVYVEATYYYEDTDTGTIYELKAENSHVNTTSVALYCPSGVNYISDCIVSNHTVSYGGYTIPGGLGEFYY
jgi:hypothetical protein